MQKIPGLDGIRAIAILAVFAQHGLYGHVRGGFLGVDLFFVLSGFLITSLLAEEYAKTGSLSLRGFYLRRALRILPPLPIAIGLALLLHQASIGAAIPVLLFFANYVPQPQSLGGLMHTWSLSVEEHFYFVWPVVFLLCMGQRRRLLAYAILAAIGCRIAMLAFSGDAMNVQRFTHTRMDSLALGCLAALLLRHGWEVRPGMAGIALAGVLACFLFVPPDSFWTLTIGYTLFAALCALAVAGAKHIRALEHPVLAYIGQRSYGLYLYHLPIFWTAEQFREPRDAVNFVAVKLAALGATFLIAEASFQTIERFALSFRGRFHGYATTSTIGGSRI